MNFSQKAVLFILILVSVLYVYFAFLGNDFKFPEFKPSGNNQPAEYSPLNNNYDEEKKSNILKLTVLSILIALTLITHNAL